MALSAILWLEPKEHTFHVASATTENGTVLDLVGRYGSLAVQVVGSTWTGTITFKASVDGTNYVAIEGVNVNDGSKASTTTGNGIFLFSVNGVTKFMADHTRTAGSVTVKGVAQAIPPGNLVDDVKVIGSNVADGWENPYNTSQGQKVVSVSEPWGVRLSRQGLVRNAHVESVALTSGVGTNVLLQTVTTGYTGWPLHITISATGAGLAIIAFQRSSGGSWENITKYLGVGGSWELQPEGLIKVGSATQIQLIFKADAVGQTGHASLLWAEVAD